MADISYIQKEDLEDSDEAMDAEDYVENNDYPCSDGPEFRSGIGSGGGGGDGDGGGGDEGGGEQHFQLTRLKEQATSNTAFNRQMVGRILVEIFHAAVNNGTKLVVSDVMEPVQQIIDDPEAQVRSDLVEQLPHVAMICQKAPRLFGDVLLHPDLLRIITRYLRDTDNHVRQAAQTALLTLIKRGLLDNSTIELEVCPEVVYLSHMSIEYINSGITLMSKMSPLIGTELTEKVFLDRYITLCEDAAFYVRKACAAHFGEISAAVGRKALFRRLFPIFVDLCCDKVWSVRKACVDVMMPVSCCLTLQYRRLLLAEILASHLNDDSKWVRMSAFQILGPFISTFAKQFTEVTYNQHGELVFTSQQDSHFSIRYSYEGIFPTKCAIRSQTFDTEDYNSKENLASPVIFSDNSLKDEDAEAEKNRISLMIAYKHKKKHLQNKKYEDADDTDKYNPFLYYYIPPDLPLDDELVQAAKKSSTESKSSSASTAGCSPNRSEDSLEASKSDAKDSSEESPAVFKETTITTASTTPHPDSRKSPCEDDEAVCDSFRVLYDSLNDTIDVSNISLDKGSPGDSLSSKAKQPKAEVKNGGQEIVPQDLVTYFVSMANPEQCTDMGADIPLHCAFSFPAVALTLGRENWPCLKEAYKLLAGAEPWKVRRTLASSIHEIALILGEELAATDLVPIYDGFIKDLDEVRIGVLKHLATFLGILKPADRRLYLPRLYDFLATDNEWNWRFREELATQLLKAVNLFNLNDVAQHIAPLSLQLLADKVAAVRHIALSLVTQIVSHLSSDDALVTALIQELREMLAINMTKWIRRQTYALLCAELISSQAITVHKFSKEMLPSLLNLSWDKVPNVRLAVARTLARNVAFMGYWENEQWEDVDRRLKQLRSDPDRDVRLLAGGDERHVPVTVSQKKTEQTGNILF